MNATQRTALGEANNLSWEAAGRLRAARKAGDLAPAAAEHLTRADLLLVEFRAALEAAVKAARE